MAGESRAASGPWLDHEHARVRLIAASETSGAGEALRLGLQFELRPGWKIYWRSPGDAGYPPQLDWSDTPGLESAELRWPVPHRFTLFGLETFGYADQVVLPIVARPREAGAPLALEASLNYLVCSEICVPHDGMLTLALPAGPQTSSPDAYLIEQYESLVPGDGGDVGLSLEQAYLVQPPDQAGAAPLLEVVARSTTPFAAPDLLVEAPPGFVFDKPQVTLSEGGTRALLRLDGARGPAAEGVLEGKRLTLTLTDGQRGLEAEVIGRYGEAAVLAATSDGRTASQAGVVSSLPVMLMLAVLGGLILNLMPCVLPVLSIKLLSVVSHGGRDRGAVRLSFLASAAGIVASFLVLAAVAVALKGAGLAAGWGIQFQQPLFLSAMALIITLFALNLFGLFEIVLPGRVADLAASAGAPKPGHRAPSLGGHFLTGAFATLLATPCSAPFLGTAVGFALARGAAEILAIFAALGLGLALPYLLVAAVPALATRLPKPGPWMLWLRRLLGLALAPTAAWLLSVLAAQSGPAAALTVATLLVGLAVILALRHGRRPALTAPLTVSAGLAALLALGAPLAFPAAERPQAPVLAAEAWQPFDRAQIARLVAQGKVVFVDVTADWCITCQVNKSLVIDRDPVAEQLAGETVVAMRGDWTRPSDMIAAYLASFGRYGIPFNAVYGPGLPQGEALPELLTSEAVLAALERARGGTAAVAGR
ncbi:MAG: protein-disulfide reductase DsbD family protein [Kiloniellales bacterium]